MPAWGPHKSRARLERDNATKERFSQEFKYAWRTPQKLRVLGVASLRSSQH